MSEVNENTVDEFLFLNKKDLERAKKEKVTIEKLNVTMASNDVEAVFSMYRKAVSKRYFVTPVGLSFLSKTREYLSENGKADELPVIPVVPVRHGISEETYEEVKKRLNDREAELDRQLLIKKKLIVVIVALSVCVIGMILIVATSDNLGFINAEEKVLDKYSAWEEELNEREALIREKEEELK